MAERKVEQTIPSSFDHVYAGAGDGFGLLRSVFQVCVRGRA